MFSSASRARGCKYSVSAMSSSWLWEADTEASLDGQRQVARRPRYLARSCYAGRGRYMHTHACPCGLHRRGSRGGAWSRHRSRPLVLQRDATPARGAIRGCSSYARSLWTSPSARPDCLSRAGDGAGRAPGSENEAEPLLVRRRGAARVRDVGVYALPIRFARTHL